ncbi:MAG: mechanosensitive ion channel family protein [Vulcanimicrobiaceae bacterium]
MRGHLVHGNGPTNYAIALGTLAAAMLVVVLASRYGPISRRLRRKQREGRATEIDRYLLIQIERTFVPLAYIGALFLAVATLHLGAADRHALRAVAIVVGAWAIVRIALGTFRLALAGYVARTGATGANMRAFTPFVSVLAWGFAVVFVLDDLGFHVSAIVAGLGIGGAAVALAAQSLLKDWFGYIALVSDRPFELGQFVQVGTDHIGTIDAIGVRSIRMRSLSGEEVTIPNSDVATSRLRNFTRMQERRILFTFAVSHATPNAQLEAIPGIVRTAIETQALVRFDRSHWLSIADAGFVYENVYFVLSPEYNLYMDVQNAINLAIVASLRASEIELAGPPLTVNVAAAPI